MEKISFLRDLEDQDKVIWAASDNNVIITILSFVMGIAGSVISLVLDINPLLSIIMAIVLWIPAPVITVLLIIIPIRKSVGKVQTMERHIKKFNNSVMEKRMDAYLHNTLKVMGHFISKLSTQPTSLDNSQVSRLFKILFETKSMYYGFNTSLPSKFKEDFGDYLELHERALVDMDKDERGFKGYRLCVTERAKIQEDASNPKFTDFWDWHDEHKVGLFTMTPIELDEILKNTTLDVQLCNAGMGLWKGEFAFMFSKNNSGFSVKYINKTDDDFLVIQKALEDLVEIGEPIDRKDGVYMKISDELADNWVEYVLPDKRWDRIGSFLKDLIEPYGKGAMILDAAAGIGIEYQKLTQEQRWRVEANEFQEELVVAGTKYSNTHDLEQYDITNVTREDWKNLRMGRKNWYQIILVIGNSLRVLGQKEGQEQSIKRFYDLLSPDGILIIDERNYHKIIREHKRIDACIARPGDVAAFKKLTELTTHPQNPLYHGTKIKSVPIGYDPESNMIKYRYYSVKKTQITNINNVNKNKIQKADWEFYHFEPLETLLTKVGFSTVDIYSDYELKNKVTPDDMRIDSTAVYVYVATK